MIFASDQPASESGASTPGAGHEHNFAGANAQIADKLCQAGDILAAQGADPFRVAPYRRAVDSVRALDDDLRTIAECGGRKALERIPGVGVSIAGAIAEMLSTGRWAFLDHLKGTANPETLFQAVTGIGPALARQVYETLHVHTLEALETAAHDGRLEQVAGIGPRRAAMVRAALAEMLGSRCSTPAAGPGILRHSIRTPRGRTNSGGRPIGS